MFTFIDVLPKANTLLDHYRFGRRSNLSSSSDDVEAKGKALTLTDIDKLAPERSYSEWKKDSVPGQAPPGSSGSYIVWCVASIVARHTLLSKLLSTVPFVWTSWATPTSFVNYPAATSFMPTVSAGGSREITIRVRCATAITVQ